MLDDYSYSDVRAALDRVAIAATPALADYVWRMILADLKTSLHLETIKVARLVCKFFYRVLDWPLRRWTFRGSSLLDMFGVDPVCCFFFVVVVSLVECFCHCHRIRSKFS